MEKLGGFSRTLARETGRQMVKDAVLRGSLLPGVQRFRNWRRTQTVHAPSSRTSPQNHSAALQRKKPPARVLLAGLSSLAVPKSHGGTRSVSRAAVWRRAWFVRCSDRLRARILLTSSRVCVGAKKIKNLHRLMLLRLLLLRLLLLRFLLLRFLLLRLLLLRSLNGRNPGQYT